MRWLRHQGTTTRPVGQAKLRRIALNDLPTSQAHGIFTSTQCILEHRALSSRQTCTLGENFDEGFF